MEKHHSIRIFLQNCFVVVFPKIIKIYIKVIFYVEILRLFGYLIVTQRKSFYKKILSL